MFASVRRQLREDPVETLTRAELEGRVETVREVLGAVARYEARLVCALDALDDGGLDGAGVLRSRGRRSSRAARRSARLAVALESLPQTAEALERGEITVEHAAGVATAAEQTTPEQADTELTGEAKAAPADVFAKRARTWAGRRQYPDDADARYRRQRANREFKHWIDKHDGRWMFVCGTDPVTGAAILSTVEAREQALWRDDGGRDGTPDEVRTRTQRLADAFAELVTGHRAPADGDVAAAHATKGGSDVTNQRDHNSRDGAGAGHRNCACGGAPPMGHPKHHVVVVYDIAGQTTPDGRPLASMVADGQPLPAQVLEHLACDAAITPMLFNGAAHPLWVGRTRRHATVAQWIALIARDRGCVGCGAAPNRCEAHHHNPWAPPDNGETDIDNLALVCTRCHHDIHNRGMQLHHDTNGRWHITPRAGPPDPTGNPAEDLRQHEQDPTQPPIGHDHHSDHDPRNPDDDFDLTA